MSVWLSKSKEAAFASPARAGWASGARDQAGWAEGVGRGTRLGGRAEWGEGLGRMGERSVSKDAFPVGQRLGGRDTRTGSAALESKM